MTDEPASKAPEKKRLSDRVREAGRYGREEFSRKGSIPDKAHGLFRGWLRKVWQSRGGGFYALGFAVTFLYLEINDILFDDIPTLATINVLSADIADFIIDFVIDTFMNTMAAFMWPVWLIQWQSPWGIGLLVAGFALFPKFVQKPVENWLFEGQPPPPPEKKKKKSKKPEPNGT